MMKPMEEITTNPTPKAANTPSSTCVERKPRPQKEKAILNCPRCNSTNTKFCYYNNYSLTQPRYFCKACKRYWTEGGSLRSIPVGGRTRKNRRSYVTSPSSTATKIKLHADLVDQSSNINICTNPNPKLVHYSQDLNLGFTSNLLHLPNNINGPYDQNKNTHFIDQTLDGSNNNSHYISAVDLLTGISASSRGVMMAPFMPMQISYPNISVYPVGFNSLQSDLRPSLSFSLDGGHNLQGVNEAVGGGGRTTTTTTTTTATFTTPVAHHQHQDHSSDQLNTRNHLHGDSTGYWTGNILGGAGSW